MKKFFGFIVVLILVVIVGYNVYKNQAEPPKPTEEPIVTPSPTVITPTPTAEISYKTASAVYSGRIDLNSIEIVVDGEYVMAKLSDELKQDFDDLALTEEDNIKIKYLIKGEHYEVYEIIKN